MDTVFRVFVIYVFLIAGMRVIGKREFGQLSAQEFVILLLIPEIVSTALNRNDTSITNAILGVSTLFCLVFLTSVLTHRFKPMETLIADSSAVLVHKGDIFEDMLNRERVTPEEIMEEARKSGIDSIDKIKWAVLEPDGSIAIVPEDTGNNFRSDKKPSG